MYLVSAGGGGNLRGDSLTKQKPGLVNRPTRRYFFRTPGRQKIKRPVANLRARNIGRESMQSVSRDTQVTKT